MVGVDVFMANACEERRDDKRRREAEPKARTNPRRMSSLLGLIESWFISPWIKAMATMVQM